MKIPHRGKGVKMIRAAHSSFENKVALPLQPLLYNQVIAGAALFIAAAAALIWANSPWAESYFHWREIRFSLGIGGFSFSDTLHHLVNDGLMALFFFAVGLEIKEEMVKGSLASARKAMMPVIAALGGIIVPALFFAAFNRGPEVSQGWAIPVATDIAFALGVLALFGNRIPPEGRAFLLALATVDDIGGILIIAFFYSGSVSVPALACAAAVFAGILLLQKMKVLSAAVYALMGLLLWAAFYESGIHAAISGVILGLVTPAKAALSHDSYEKMSGELNASLKEAVRRRDDNETETLLGKIEALTLLTESPLERAQRTVHWGVNFLVLPLFALANSGVVVSAEVFSQALQSTVIWGILAGLVLGKPIGILAFAWCAVKLKAASLPARVTPLQFAGISMLCGIGFTVSLFIVNLSYESAKLVSEAKLGVLAASLLAGIAGFAVLARGRGLSVSTGAARYDWGDK